MSPELPVLAKETHGTVIRFAPPLIITKSDLDWALERIAQVLK
jgi:ornithine--oxo-acid transaminase